MNTEDDRWFERFAGESMRAAARRWSQRQRTKGRAVEVRARLSADWVQLVGVHGKNAPPGVFFAVFEALAHRMPGDLPSSRLVRQMMRMVLAFPTREGWAALAPLLRGPGEVSPEQWSSTVHSLWHLRRTRTASAARFEELHGVYATVARVRLPDLEEFALETFAERPRDMLTGSTDGGRVWLPATMALTDDLLMNGLAACRVLFRELGLVRGGSFSLDPGALRVGVLANRIEQARAKGHALNVSRARFGAPPIERLFHLFLRPAVLHGLWSMVEDARVDARLELEVPSFANLRATVAALGARQDAPLAFESADGLFFRALSRRLTGLEPEMRVAERHRALDARVAQQLRASPVRCLGTTAESLALAIDLYGLLVEDAETRCDRALLKRAAAPGDANDLAAFRGGLHVVEDGSTHHPTSAGQCNVTSYNFGKRPEERSVFAVPSFRYPEWNANERILEANVVEVVEPWTGVRLEDEVLRGLSATPRRTHLRRWRTRRSEEGRMDGERAYDWAVERRMSHDAGPRTPRQAVRQGRSVSRMIHVVVDVSSSMSRDESERISPIELAREMLERLDRRLVQGTRCRLVVYAGIDAGRRIVSMELIKGPHQEYEAGWTQGIRPWAMGGFRVGAFVRHLASRHSRPGDRILLMTDAASHYVAPGYDQTLAGVIYKYCIGCPQVARCPHDPLQFVVEGYKTKLPYLSTFYELADLRHAVATCGSPVGLLVFGRGYEGPMLDRAVGLGSWWRVAGLQHIDVALERIETWCLGHVSA